MGPLPHFHPGMGEEHPVEEPILADPKDRTTLGQNDPLLELESEENGEIGTGGGVNFPILLEDESPPGQPEATREVRNVASINAGGNLLLTQLARDETVLKFSGRSGDFDTFHWQLERYFKRLASCQGIEFTDQVKMFLLEKALPEYDKRWLQLLEREGASVTYQSVIARLRARAGSNVETQARQKWNTLTFRTSGKITVGEF